MRKFLEMRGKQRKSLKNWCRILEVEIETEEIEDHERLRGAEAAKQEPFSKSEGKGSVKAPNVNIYELSLFLDTT